MRAARRLRALSLSAVAAIALSIGADFSIPALAATAPASTEAFSLKILSPGDARAYAAAFALVKQGRFDAAGAAVAKLDDRVLVGRLTFAKLMHPDYTATYPELAAWLDANKDLPEADRIYALARKRQPIGAPAPAAPQASAQAASADWRRVEALAQRLEAKAPQPRSEADLQAAREAFYGGDIRQAYSLAVQSGERWIAGLAAFQLKRYADARSRFAELIEDPNQDEWIRSGAAYWAARASIAAGEPEAAPQYLGVAARTPYTFYGLIAERQLGLEPAIGPKGLDMAALAARGESASRAAVVTGADGAALSRLTKSDRRAARAAAFAQLGMKAEAGQEIRAALQSAGADSRRGWTLLALALNAPISSAADLERAPAPKPRFDIAQFPTPELSPQGGFTVEKALVYALVKQESRFNAAATSPGGAYGLMQLMPATAARVAGDDKLSRNPSALKDPAVNLRLGQDYVSRLLVAVDGDLLHAVAAYNSGPGVITKTIQRLGKDADSLLAIESMPGAQTREFVERVMASYWIYRNLFGQESQTLDAAASGAKAIMANLDREKRPRKSEDGLLAGLFAASK